MLSVQEDTVETSDPESTVTKIEVTHIGKTASALTDSFITMMQFISIGTFIIFAVLSLIVSGSSALACPNAWPRSASRWRR